MLTSPQGPSRVFKELSAVVNQAADEELGQFPKDAQSLHFVQVCYFLHCHDDLLSNALACDRLMAMSKQSIGS
jgi:hypothetical protein